MELELKHPGPADQFTEMKQDVLAWNASPTRPVSRRNCRAPQPCSCTSSFTGNIFIACTTRPSTSSLSSSSTSRGMASKRGGKQVGRELGLCRGFGSADEFYCAILLSCSLFPAASRTWSEQEGQGSESNHGHLTVCSVLRQNLQNQPEQRDKHRKVNPSTGPQLKLKVTLS